VGKEGRRSGSRYALRALAQANAADRASIVKTLFPGGMASWSGWARPSRATRSFPPRRPRL